MKHDLSRVFLPFPGLALGLLLVGCASSSESAERDKMTANVGIYEPPPPGIKMASVGVPGFQVEKSIQAEMSQQAADQLVSLGANTNRFEMIERNQLDALLKEQGLEGIVKGSELAKPAQVRGVDFLLLGKVTNLRVKAERTGTGFNLGSIPIPGTSGALGLFDINNRESKVHVDCGVDLRLVDPSTGKVAVANFSEYKRTDSIGALGISVLGANAKADADLKVNEDSQGKILRLALDDCLKKMMPKIDQVLVARAKAEAAKSSATQPDKAK